MDLKTLLGDAYKENMTLDEINEALEGVSLVDPSTLPKMVNKDVFDKTASELAKVKKQLKELQEKSMTEDEKLQAEMDKAKEMQTRFQKEIAKFRAKEIFVTAGLKEEDYEKILDTVVTDDEEITKTRAKNMVDLIVAQKAATEAAVKAELLRNTSRPPAGSGGDQGGALAKEIEDAKKNGDMVSVAALIRQQAQLEAQQNTK